MIENWVGNYDRRKFIGEHADRENHPFLRTRIKFRKKTQKCVKMRTDDDVIPTQQQRDDTSPPQRGRGATRVHRGQRRVELERGGGFADGGGRLRMADKGQRGRREGKSSSGRGGGQSKGVAGVGWVVLVLSEGAPGNRGALLVKIIPSQ